MNRRKSGFIFHEQFFVFTPAHNVNGPEIATESTDNPVSASLFSIGGSFTICLILALAAVQRVAIENGLSKK